MIAILNPALNLIEKNGAFDVFLWVMDNHVSFDIIESESATLKAEGCSF